ncbi:MAG: TolC family protein [Bacteroidia bacterium]
MKNDSFVETQCTASQKNWSLSFLRRVLSRLRIIHCYTLLPITFYLILITFYLFPNTATAQIFTLDSAYARLEKHPAVLAADHQIEASEAMTGTAFQAGQTQLFVSGEEIRKENGVFTLLGIGQQNLDLLNTGRRRHYLEMQVLSSRAQRELIMLEARRACGIAYVRSIIFQKQDSILQHQDSLLRDLREKEAIKLQQGAGSRLSLLALDQRLSRLAQERMKVEAKVKVEKTELQYWIGNIENKSLQLQNDVEDKLFVEGLLGGQPGHPAEVNAEANASVAFSNVSQQKILRTPTFNFQGGYQQVDRLGGHYAFQVGIQSNLLGKAPSAQKQAAEASFEAAKSQLEQVMSLLQKEVINAFISLKQAFSSLESMEKETLPLARELASEAAFAYRQGAIDYLSFFQHLDALRETEMEWAQRLLELHEANIEYDYWSYTVK